MHNYANENSDDTDDDDEDDAMMHIYANALMKTVFKLMKKEEDTLN